jgi:hypothetical protein
MEAQERKYFEKYGSEVEQPKKRSSAGSNYNDDNMLLVADFMPRPKKCQMPIMQGSRKGQLCGSNAHYNSKTLGGRWQHEDIDLCSAHLKAIEKMEGKLKSSKDELSKEQNAVKSDQEFEEWLKKQQPQHQQTTTTTSSSKSVTRMMHPENIEEVEEEKGSVMLPPKKKQKQTKLKLANYDLELPDAKKEQNDNDDDDKEEKKEERKHWNIDAEGVAQPTISADDVEEANKGLKKTKKKDLKKLVQKQIVSYNKYIEDKNKAEKEKSYDLMPMDSNIGPPVSKTTAKKDVALSYGNAEHQSLKERLRKIRQKAKNKTGRKRFATMDDDDGK